MDESDEQRLNVALLLLAIVLLFLMKDYMGINDMMGYFNA